MRFRKMTMTKRPARLKIPRRTRIMFALRKISHPLQADIIADLALVKRWDIGVQRTLTLAPNLAVRSSSLFSAFRHAADGSPPPPLLDADGKICDAKISIDSAGTALVEIGKRSIRFSHA